MSLRMTQLAWKVKTTGGAERVVLLRLADAADDDGGSIYPAVATVAEDCDVSERTVQYTLKRFEERGWLIPVSGAAGGRHRTREWALDVDALVAALRPGYRVEADGAVSKIPEGRNPAKGAKGADELHPFQDSAAPAEVAQATVHPFPKKGAKGANPAKALHPLETPQRMQTPQSLHPLSAGKGEKGAADDMKGCKAFAPEQSRTMLLLLKGADATAGEAVQADAPATPAEVPADEPPELRRETTVEAVIQAFDAARIAAFGSANARRCPHGEDAAEAEAWIAAGADLDLTEGVFAAGCSRAATLKHDPPNSLKFFRTRVLKAVAAHVAPLPDIAVDARGAVSIRPASGPVQPEPKIGKHAPATRQIWRQRVAGWVRPAKGGKPMWLPSWGPLPTEPGCECPPDIVAEFFATPAEPTLPLEVAQ